MLELCHYSTKVGENFEYCTSQMPKNASGGGNYCIFKFQIFLPPKLNLQISFPSQKLSSPGKINNQFPPQANQIQNFHSSPKVWGGMTLWYHKRKYKFLTYQKGVVHLPNHKAVSPCWKDKFILLPLKDWKILKDGPYWHKKNTFVLWKCK